MQESSLNHSSIFVVAYDFSPHSDAALYTAADLAMRFSAEIRILHVLQNAALMSGATIPYGDPAPHLLTPKLRESALASLEKIASQIVLPTGVATAHVVEGFSVDRAIVEFCEQANAELLIMGTHGRTGMAHVFLGSVAERTLRRAPCPVVTVRSSEDEDE